MNKYLIFDVESLGLHGPGFAVGYAVIDGKRKELESGIAISRNSVNYIKNMITNNSSNKIIKGIGYSTTEDVKWVYENVLPTLPEPTHESIVDVRNWFWDIWMKWKAEGATLVADVNWPVETNFLSECVRDDFDVRRWEGPYPFIDLSSILLKHGKNPVGAFDRLESEVPAHNPLNDARQSARILNEVLL